METKPKHEHDCDYCIFLGQLGSYDLYFCPIELPTVIARFGSGGKYLSGMLAAQLGQCTFLAEALRRAVREGLTELL